MIPESASSIEPKIKEPQETQEGNILALVKGEKVYFTRKEAFALASQLIICLEVYE